MRQRERVRQLIAPYRGQEVVVEGTSQLGPYRTKPGRCVGVTPFEGAKRGSPMLHLEHSDGGHEWLYLQHVEKVTSTASG